MKTVHPSRLLAVALLADAGVSGAVAALQLAVPGWLSDHLLLPRSLLVESGAFLVAYVALLLGLARRRTVWSALIAMVVAGNVGWALGCAALVASGTVAPNALGIAFLAAHVVAVLVFAVLEWKGLAASAPVAGGRAARATGARPDDIGAAAERAQNEPTPTTGLHHDA